MKFKNDMLVLLGVTLLLMGAVVLMVLRLLDQSETHVKTVKDMKVKYTSVAFQPEAAEAEACIKRDLREERSRKSAEYRNLVLNKQCFKLIARMWQLRELKLCDCEFKSDWLKYLTDLSLHRLDLSGTDVDDEGMKHIANMPQLRILILYDTKLSGKSLSELKRLTKLNEIELNGTAVKDEDVAALEDLPVETVNLSGTYVGDKACDSLAKMERLHKLDLSHTQITRAGLAKLKALKNLQVLEVKTCHLTDDDIAVIAQFPGLEKVFVSGNPEISEKGILQLANLKNLDTIIAADCPNVTEKTAQALARARPKMVLTLSDARNATLQNIVD